MPEKRKPELVDQIKRFQARLSVAGIDYPNREYETRDQMVSLRDELRLLLREKGLEQKGDFRPRDTLTENHNVEGVTALIESAIDPFQTLVDAAKESGLNPSVADAVVRRLKGQHQSFMNSAKALSTNNMVSALNQKIAMVLEFIDPVVLAQASFRDLTVGLGILIEKRQLLSGEPTQILSLDERKNLRDMLPVLMKEAKRRSITIEQVPDEITRSIPPQKVPEEQLNSTARRIKPKEDEAHL